MLDPEVHAIACSGYSASAGMSKWQSLGFKGALHKPFSPVDVRRLVGDASSTRGSKG